MIVSVLVIKMNEIKFELWPTLISAKTGVALSLHINFHLTVNGSEATAET
jgi:hypothetical protein